MYFKYNWIQQIVSRFVLISSHHVNDKIYLSTKNVNILSLITCPIAHYHATRCSAFISLPCYRFYSLSLQQA